MIETIKFHFRISRFNEVFDCKNEMQTQKLQDF